MSCIKSYEDCFQLHQFGEDKFLPCYMTSDGTWMVPVTMLQQMFFSNYKLCDVERSVEKVTKTQLVKMKSLELKQMTYSLSNSSNLHSFPPLSTLEYACTLDNFKKNFEKLEEIFSDGAAKRPKRKLKKAKSRDTFSEKIKGTKETKSELSNSFRKKSSKIRSLVVKPSSQKKIILNKKTVTKISSETTSQKLEEFSYSKQKKQSGRDNSSNQYRSNGISDTYSVVEESRNEEKEFHSSQKVVLCSKYRSKIVKKRKKSKTFLLDSSPDLSIEHGKLRKRNGSIKRTSHMYLPKNPKEVETFVEHLSFKSNELQYKEPRKQTSGLSKVSLSTPFAMNRNNNNTASCFSHVLDELEEKQCNGNADRVSKPKTGSDKDDVKNEKRVEKNQQENAKAEYVKTKKSRQLSHDDECENTFKPPKFNGEPIHYTRQRSLSCDSSFERSYVSHKKNLSNLSRMKPSNDLHEQSSKKDPSSLFKHEQTFEVLDEVCFNHYTDNKSSNFHGAKNDNFKEFWLEHIPENRLFNREHKKEFSQFHDENHRFLRSAHAQEIPIDRCLDRKPSLHADENHFFKPVDRFNLPMQLETNRIEPMPRRCDEFDRKPIYRREPDFSPRVLRPHKYFASLSQNVQPKLRTSFEQNRYQSIQKGDLGYHKRHFVPAYKKYRYPLNPRYKPSYTLAPRQRPYIISHVKAPEESNINENGSFDKTRQQYPQSIPNDYSEYTKSRDALNNLIKEIRSQNSNSKPLSVPTTTPSRVLSTQEDAAVGNAEHKSNSSDKNISHPTTEEHNILDKNKKIIKKNLEIHVPSEFVTIDEEWDMDSLDENADTVCLDSSEQLLKKSVTACETTSSNWPLSGKFEGWKDVFCDFDLEKTQLNRSSVKSDQANIHLESPVKLPFQWKKKLIEKAGLSFNDYANAAILDGPEDTFSKSLLSDEISNKVCQETDEHSGIFYESVTLHLAQNLKEKPSNNEQDSVSPNTNVHFATALNSLNTNGTSISNSTKKTAAKNSSSATEEREVNGFNGKDLHGPTAKLQFKDNIDPKQDGISNSNDTSPALVLSKEMHNTTPSGLKVYSEWKDDIHKISNLGFHDESAENLKEIYEDFDERSTDDLSSDTDFETIPLRSYAKTPVQEKLTKLQSWNLKDCVVRIEKLKLPPELQQANVPIPCNNELSPTTSNADVMEKTLTDTCKESSRITGTKIPKVKSKQHQKARKTCKAKCKKSVKRLHSLDCNSTCSLDKGNVDLELNNEFVEVDKLTLIPKIDIGRTNSEFTAKNVSSCNSPKETRKNLEDNASPSLSSSTTKVVLSPSKLSVASRLRSSRLVRRRTELPSVSSDEENFVSSSQEAPYSLTNPSTDRGEITDDDMLLVSCKPFLHKSSKSNLMKNETMAKRAARKTCKRSISHTKGNNARKRFGPKVLSDWPKLISTKVFLATSSSISNGMDSAVSKPQDRPIRPLNSDELASSTNDSMEKPRINEGALSIPHSNSIEKDGVVDRTRIDQSDLDAQSTSLSSAHDRTTASGEKRAALQKTTELNEELASTDVQSSDKASNNAKDLVEKDQTFNDLPQDRPETCTTQTISQSSANSTNSTDTQPISDFADPTTGKSLSVTKLPLGPSQQTFTNTSSFVNAEVRTSNLNGQCIDLTVRKKKDESTELDPSLTEPTNHVNDNVVVSGNSRDSCKNVQNNPLRTSIPSVMQSTSTSSSRPMKQFNQHSENNSVPDNQNVILSPSAKSMFGETYHHGMMEIHLSAPSAVLEKPNTQELVLPSTKIVFIKRRIPYIQLKIKKTESSTPNIPNHNVKNSDESDTNTLLIRIRDAAFSLRLNPAELVKQVTALAIPCYSPNKYSQSVYELIYNPVAQGNEMLASMLGFYPQLTSTMVNENSMINLNDYLKVILPHFYMLYFRIHKNHLPEFVCVTTYKPIDIVTPFVVKTFSNSYAFNCTLIKSDIPIKNLSIASVPVAAPISSKVVKRKSTSSEQSKGRATKRSKPTRARKAPKQTQQKIGNKLKQLTFHEVSTSSVSTQNGQFQGNALLRPQLSNLQTSCYQPIFHPLSQMNEIPQMQYHPGILNRFNSDSRFNIHSKTAACGIATPSNKFTTTAERETTQKIGLNIYDINFVNETEAVRLSQGNIRKSGENTLENRISGNSILKLNGHIANASRQQQSSEEKKLTLGAKFVNETAGTKSPHSVEELQQILQSIQASGYSSVASSQAFNGFESNSAVLNHYSAKPLNSTVDSVGVSYSISRNNASSDQPLFSAQIPTNRAEAFHAQSISQQKEENKAVSNPRPTGNSVIRADGNIEQFQFENPVQALLREGKITPEELCRLHSTLKQLIEKRDETIKRFASGRPTMENNSALTGKLTGIDT